MIQTDKHNELLRVSKTMETCLAELRDREAELYMQVQENITKTNDADLERDKVLLREGKLQTDISRVEAKFAQAQEKYRDKAETEIATIRTQFISEKNRLNTELEELENSCSKMKVMAERAVREKRYIGVNI